jgi:hypothetical protein
VIDGTLAELPELPELADEPEPDDDDPLELLLFDDPHAAIVNAAMIAKIIAKKPALLVRKCTVYLLGISSSGSGGSHCVLSLKATVCPGS